MARGRGRGHGGSGGRGGGHRGKRGGSGGFRGGGGSRGRGRGGISLSKRDIGHLDQFGEQHPSQEMHDFGPSSSKWQKFDGNSRGGRGVRGGGGNNRGFRGRRGYNDGGRSRPNNRYNGSSSSDSDEEEATPYNQLLSLISKNKGAKKEIQILSDEEEEESDDDEDVEEEEVAAEIEGENGSGEGASEDDSDEEDQIKKKKTKSQSNKAERTEGSAKEDVQRDKSTDLELEPEVELPNVEETVIEEAELDPDMEEALESENASGSIDSFLLHFEREMSGLLQTHMKAEKPDKIEIPEVIWPQIDKFKFSGLNAKALNEEEENEKKSQSLGIDLSLVGKAPPLRIPEPPLTTPKNLSLESLHVKPLLCTTLPIVNQSIIDKENCQSPLTPLQMEIMSLASRYYDVYFPMRTLENAEAIRVAYCLHAANHIIKTRTRILHHNAKMVNKVEVSDAYRDQGFVRPKVLILVPFKDSALRVVKTLTSLFLVEEKGNVANKKRFLEEYGGSNLFLPKTNPKPDDYNAIFGGNVEDNFKMGLSLTKKTLKLYTGFYSSDIIIASPLGLRLIIGADGEKDRDYDFLSSIELLIMDQADIFLMQNWDHVLHLMKHLHLQPVTTHGTDFARIRPWALDGLTKFFSQTLIFSSLMCPEHSALMSRYCRNYSGQVFVINPLSRGSICDVTVHLPQVFKYFECDSLQEADDARFNFFVKKIVPEFTDKLMSHTLVFVSSYFDFVRLRNHFKREEIGFVQICEYTKEKKVARARDYFFHGQSHFMLYTERVHFFRRFRLKGIGHIIFYQLPQYPHFYPELCNSIREDFQNRRVQRRKNSSVNVIYCKYDTLRLAAVVGADKAALMLDSEKDVHLFES